MHKFAIIFALLASVACSLSCGRSAHQDARPAIRAVLEGQVKAWNEGNIEEFLDGYIKSPELLFASRGTFSRGWDPLL
ncbi:MAG: DUF4440 domain-containing protein, partial [Candidatus Krumholzibacteria bacterium]|nr:DUF4440 domain-containing protein [Candidatus Krumholzibacteria bacterium]